MCCSSLLCCCTVLHVFDRLLILNNKKSNNKPKKGKFAFCHKKNACYWFEHNEFTSNDVIGNKK